MPEIPSPPRTNPPPAPNRVTRLQVAVSIGGLALLWTSRALWTPQTAFPQIPAIAGVVFPDAASWAIAAAIAAGLMVSLIQGLRGSRSRSGAAACLIAMTLLILEDLHRFQAWTVHLLWLWAIFAAARRDAIPRLVLGLTIAVYFWSAVSKFNPAFADQHGRMLLDALAKVSGIEIKHWPAAVLARLPYAFPAVETLLAAGLAWNKTRTLSAWLAVAMHLALIATLGPWGLNHARGVLIWNGLFVVQALLLWCVPETNRSGPNAKAAPANPTVYDRLLLIAILVLPAGRILGLVDQWAGWSLYSPRTELIRIRLAREPVSIDPAFPDLTSRPYRMIQGDFAPLEFVPDRWSLAALDVPLNPESRMELAVAIALCERFDCWDAVSIERERRSLFSNATERETSTGRDQILALAGTYRLNLRANRRFVDGVPP